jgi:tryptophanyl-tRNA synthetase
MKVLSGIQPSGSLHLGNYYGAIAQFLSRQTKGDELYIFIADWHALTSVGEAGKLQRSISEVASAYLALGLDPTKTTLYRQSDVPEIAELAWLLACVAPMGLLERAHSYKDKLAKGIAPTVGLFTYPVLMAADILALQPDVVPVGRDQKQHLEITRDLAEKFNINYGETLKLPTAETPDSVAVVPGVDGQKMSKSYGNTIDLFAEDNALKKQVMSVVTDSTPKGSPLDSTKCNVFALYNLVATSEQTAELAKQYELGAVGYGDAKKLLLEAIHARFDPARAKFNELMKNPTETKAVLETGAIKARTIAKATLAEVRKKVGLL